MTAIPKSVFNRRPAENRYDEEDLFKFKRPAYSRNDLAVLNRLLKGRHGKKEKRTKHGGSGSCGNTAFVFPEKNQRVTFKMSYSPVAANHDAYIKFYMPQMNKSQVEEKPELFGMSAEEYESLKTALHYKCIISPERQDMDMEELARSFIRRLENHTGLSLCWRGVIHNDTEHRHAHLVINGKDRNGEKCFFNRETIELMRLMCANAATELAGARSETEIRQARARSVTAKRWTELDADIETELGDGGTVRSARLTALQESRLAFLARIKLAERKENGWQVKPEWKETLRNAGRYNTYLEEYLKGGDAPLVFYDGQEIRNAVVEKTITFDKDEAWNDALIVRSGGKRIYIPVRQLHKNGIEGKRISIRKKNAAGLARKVSDKDIETEK